MRARSALAAGRRGSAAARGSACGAPAVAAAAAAPAARQLHATAAAAYDARPLLPFNLVEPPTPEAAAG